MGQNEMVQPDTGTQQDRKALTRIVKGRLQGNKNGSSTTCLKGNTLLKE
jgi:hypothetical protein